MHIEMRLCVSESRAWAVPRSLPLQAAALALGR